jgi:plastocyanin
MRKYWYSAVINALLALLCNCSPSEKKDTSVAGGYRELETADALSPNEKKEKVHTVEIKQMKFEPAILNVHKGDEVIWINKDIVDHDVTEENKKTWTSSKLPMGASWRMVVTKSELYYCSIHVVMKGKIIVDGAELSMINSSPEITMCR